VTAKKTSLLVYLSLPLFAVACRNGSASPAPLTPGVQITSANAQEIAVLALGAAFGLAEVGEVGTGVLALQLPGPIARVDLRRMIGRRVDELLLAPAVLPASVSSTLPGPGGGQVIHTWEDRDGDERVSTGDAFVSAFTDYVDGQVELSGVVTVDQVVVAGTPPSGTSWSIGGRMTLVNLEVGNGDDTTTVVGSLRFVREQRPTVILTKLELDRGLAVGGMSLQPGNVIGYDEFPIDYAFSMTSRGAVEVAGIDGLLLYETTAPFTGITLFDYPWAGELQVRGAGSSLITIRMTDYTSMLEIEVDADGDGEIDETIEADWTAL